MLTLGVVFLVATGVTGTSRAAQLVLLVVCGAMSLLLLLGIASATLDFSETLAAAPEAAQRTVREALLRAWVFAMGFLLAYVTAMVALWRGVTPAPRR
jgi:hypothetical protein